MNDWRCDYCWNVNPGTAYKCPNCGAPKTNRATIWTSAAQSPGYETITDDFALLAPRVEELKLAIGEAMLPLLENRVTQAIFRGLAAIGSIGAQPERSAEG